MSCSTYRTTQQRGKEVFGCWAARSLVHFTAALRAAPACLSSAGPRTPRGRNSGCLRSVSIPITGPSRAGAACAGGWLLVSSMGHCQRGE